MPSNYMSIMPMKFDFLKMYPINDYVLVLEKERKRYVTCE